jgi:RNA polymerase-binding transcription factor DksA
MTAPIAVQRHVPDAASPHLTNEQLARLGDLLRADRDDQRSKLAEHTAAAESASTEEREVANALAVRTAAVVDDLDDALARLDAGTYGACEPCGAAIPFERLEAIPHARLCVACQQRPAGRLG